MNKLLTTIPFQGFYNSIHGEQIDHEIEILFSDDQGITNYDLSNKLYMSCDFEAVRCEYAAKYADNFASETGLKLEFESLKSPKEYNFMTDRIFCFIDLVDAKRFLSEVSILDLDNAVKEKFTSYSGFISFYSNDYQAWGQIETWDHNQIGCLIDAWLTTKEIEVDEFALMENSYCNGFVSGLLDKHTKDISQLYNVHNYLMARQNRAAA